VFSPHLSRHLAIWGFCYCKNKLTIWTMLWRNLSSIRGQAHKKTDVHLLNGIRDRTLVDFYWNSMETWRTCFLFLLENTGTKKRKTTCLPWSSKRKLPLIVPSLRQQLVLVLCFRVSFYFKPISARIFFGLFSDVQQYLAKSKKHRGNSGDNSLDHS